MGARILRLVRQHSRIEDNASADHAGDGNARLGLEENSIAAAPRGSNLCAAMRIKETQHAFIIVERIAQAGIARNRPFDKGIVLNRDEDCP